MADDIKIEKGVPIPVGAGRQGIRKYPWREMEIGDSVFIGCKDGETPEKVLSRLGQSLAFAKPLRFTRRREGDDVRVWRIE